MRARAVVFAAPCRVEVREVELPEPHPHEVLVASEWSGISTGTELLAYRGEIAPDTPLDEALPGLDGTFTFPFRYGYSVVGRVEEGSIEPGTPVFAFHPHQDRFVIDAAAVMPLGDLDPRLATMYPLVETALQVSLDAGLRPEEVALVTGLGPVGILVAALLRRSRVRVLGSEPVEARRRAAAAFGVEAVTPDDLPAAVEQASGGRGADALVEVSGRPEVLSDSLSLLAHEGTAWVCSWYGTKRATLPLGEAFHRRRLAVRSTQVSTIPGHLRGRWDHARRSAVAWRLMRELPLGSLATHVFPLDRASEAFAALDRGEPGLLHAALRYGEGS